MALGFIDIDQFNQKVVQAGPKEGCSEAESLRVIRDPEQGKWLRYASYGYALIRSTIPDECWLNFQYEDEADLYFDLLWVMSHDILTHDPDDIWLISRLNKETRMAQNNPERAIFKQVAGQILHDELSRPDWEQARAKIIALFNQDAQRFDQLVPLPRANKVKKLYKAIKEMDASTFKLLKPLRTAIGLIDEALFQRVYSMQRNNKQRIQLGYTDGNHRISLTFLLAIIYTFTDKVYQPLEEQNWDASAEIHVCQDPEQIMWLRYASYSFALIRSYVGENSWEHLFHGGENNDALISEVWLTSYRILTTNHVPDGIWFGFPIPLERD